MVETTDGPEAASGDWVVCFADGAGPVCVTAPARRTDEGGVWTRQLDVDLGYRVVTHSERGKRPAGVGAIARVSLDELVGVPGVSVSRP